MPRTGLLAMCGTVCVIAAIGCDDAAAGGAGAGGSGVTGGTGAGTGGAGPGGAGTGGVAGGGSLGATANIRVVNLVPDVTFAAWGPDLDSRPVVLAENLTYATASEYFEVPLNRISMEPIFVLWKEGDEPAEGQLFSMLQTDNTHERVRIQVRLEGPDVRATVIVGPQEPIDEDPASPLEYETLDESELDRGDPTQLNLHITYHLFDLGNGIVDSLAIEGETCLHGGSTSVVQVFSVPAGASTLAVYDLQTGVDCSENEPLATLPIEGDAGDNLLITLYHEQGDVKMFSAPIE